MGCAPSKPIAAGAAVAALPLSSSRHLVDGGKLNGAGRTSARSTTASTTASTVGRQQQLQEANPPAGEFKILPFVGFVLFRIH